MKGTSEVMPVDVQMRADAELGAAWRRCEAALPEGWSFQGVQAIGSKIWHALALGRRTDIICDYGVHHDEFEKESHTGPTPAAALDALTEALANR